MERQERMEQLAGLLDGEIRDASQLEQMNTQLRADNALHAEFEQQREVKRLLAQLPEACAPEFMATRVLGEIKARRRVGRGFRLKLAGAAIGGFALCLAGVGGGGIYLAQHQANTAVALQPGTVVQPGVFAVTDSMYAKQDWQVAPPADADPKLKDFLEFASQQHGYRKMLHSADEMTPDMATAVQVLDREGGQ
jgi:hypothetical protein